QNVRRKIGMHDENLIALRPRIGGSNEVKAIRGAVGEDDLLRRSVDDLTECSTQPYRHTVETRLRQFERHCFPCNRIPRSLRRRKRQGTLVSGIEPNVAGEVAEAG